MMRNWIAVALLSASWMWGLEFYIPTNGWTWSLAIIAAILLLATSPRRLPCRTNAAIAAVLTLPTLWMISWPYGAIPLFLILGLLPLSLPNAPQRIRALGWGSVRTTAILAGQAIVLRAYIWWTARSHDLPEPGPTLVAWVARLLGADASTNGSEVAIFSTSGLQRLGATWELLLDPVTVCLLAGAIVLVSLWAWEDQTPRRAKARLDSFRPWLRNAGCVLLTVLLWIPVRLGLLIGLFLHREMRAPDELKLTVMNQFFSPWVLALVSLGAVALLAWLVRHEPLDPSDEDPEQAPSPSGLRSLAISAATVVALVALATTLLVVDPVGTPKAGRVVFIERHSEWEPTDGPYDTKSYGEPASYNYSAIYKYCQQYFDVSRILEDEKIDTARLADCDVLVIKTPTQPYLSGEIRAIERFVSKGGGLLLVGEHTDYEHTSTCLNQIARPFGFKFRPDLLFAVQDPYIQHVTPRRLPHPAVRNVPFIRYAGSCSVDPGWSWGRAAVWNTGLWSLDADYNMENFFPHAQYLAQMRYGAFIQLWETRYGKGRVLAFTDSTLFSNFSTFEPGKAEFMLDMLSWLNCRSLFDSTVVRVLVRLCGLGVLAVLVWLTATRFPRVEGTWLVGLCAVLLGYLASTAAIAAWQRGALPECQRPLVRVVIDRTTSAVPLSEGGFTNDPGGYGLLEQWIPRLGHYTVRADGPEAFSGDVLLVVSPNVSVPEEYRRQLVQWVSEGGKLLVVESLDTAGTTANSLLWPFGLAVHYATAPQGKLRLESSDWPEIPTPAACHIEGGDPFMWVGQTPVAARTTHGKGTVTAIGFGALLNNQNMGSTWMMEPGPTELQNYNLLFELIESVVDNRPIRPRPVQNPQNDAADGSPGNPSETGKPQPDL